MLENIYFLFITLKCSTHYCTIRVHLNLYFFIEIFKLFIYLILCLLFIVDF